MKHKNAEKDTQFLILTSELFQRIVLVSYSNLEVTINLQKNLVYSCNLLIK